MTSFVTAIMAVPERAARASALAQRVAGQSASYPLVSWDVHHEGPWWNSRRCWGYVVQAQADFGVVLTDDALVCDGFVAAARRIAAVVPGAVVTLFTEQHRLVDGVPDGTLVPAAPFYCGAAVMMPAEVVRRGLAWIDAQPESRWRHPENDDPRWRAFFTENGIPVYTTVPSLAEHPDDLPTTIQHRCPEKVSAARYASDAGAEEVTWVADIEYISVATDA